MLSSTFARSDEQVAAFSSTNSSKLKQLCKLNAMSQSGAVGWFGFRFAKMSTFCNSFIFVAYRIVAEPLKRMLQYGKSDLHGVCMCVGYFSVVAGR